MRKAAELSQVELAAWIHSAQPHVSEADLSALANYLSAAEATDASPQVRINGQLIELPLAVGR